MQIDESTLTQLEKLAKLTVSEADHDLTVKKIVGILDMLDHINLDDIVDLAPLYHPLEINQPMRSDTADNDINREQLQRNAPLVEAGLFLVPKVIE